MDKRNLVFRQFCYHKELKFSQIQKLTQIRSNHLAHVLQKMVEEGILEKDNGSYRLTHDSEKNIPFFKENGADSPLPVVLVGIFQEGKVLLHKRTKRPYQDMWSLPGGRILLGETIEQAAQRIAKAKVNTPIQFEKISGLGNERIMDDQTRQGFLLVFVQTIPLETKDNNDTRAWFSVAQLPPNMIASDKSFAEQLVDFRFEEFIEHNHQVI